MPICTEENITLSRWELKVNTSKLLEAGEIEGDNVVSFSFASDWLRGGASFLDQS